MDINTDERVPHFSQIIYIRRWKPHLWDAAKLKSEEEK
jgi:hypothetical protein